MAKRSITVRHIIAVVVMLIIIMLVVDRAATPASVGELAPNGQPADIVVLLAVSSASDGPGLSLTLRSILRRKLEDKIPFDILIISNERASNMVSLLLEDTRCFRETKRIHTYVALDMKRGVIAQRIFEYPNLQRWSRVLHLANGVLFDRNYLVSSMAAPADAPQLHKSRTMATFAVPKKRPPHGTTQWLKTFGLHSVVSPSDSELAAARQQLAALAGCDVELNDNRTPIPAVAERNGIPKMIEEEGNHRVGVEIGVGEGAYAWHILKEWKSCTKFILMDPWVHQENYNDWANKNNEQQEQFYQNVKKRMTTLGDKVEICRDFAHVCKDNYEDEYFDFIYIDARPDYMSVSEYLYDMWPKLKAGGIIAGHDYITAKEEPHGQDWGLNRDGTRHEGSVKGAVQDFFQVVHRKIFETGEQPPHIWTTWMVRK